MAKTSGPVRPADDEARGLARDLLDRARIAALAVVLEDGAPMVSRIGFGRDAEGGAISLISDLALHTAALRRAPACSLLLGEAGPRGDPLNQPRLTLQAMVRFVPRDAPDRPALAERYLHTHPKARLYAGFGDFNFVRFEAAAGFLNSGFGRAYRLTPADMGLPG